MQTCTILNFLAFYLMARTLVDQDSDQGIDQDSDMVEERSWIGIKSCRFESRVADVEESCRCGRHGEEGPEGADNCLDLKCSANHSRRLSI